MSALSKRAHRDEQTRENWDQLLLRVFRNLITVTRLRDACNPDVRLSDDGRKDNSQHFPTSFRENPRIMSTFWNVFFLYWRPRSSARLRFSAFKNAASSACKWESISADGGSSHLVPHLGGKEGGSFQSPSYSSRKCNRIEISVWFTSPHLHVHVFRDVRPSLATRWIPGMVAMYLRSVVVVLVGILLRDNYSQYHSLVLSFPLFSRFDVFWSIYC